MMVVVVMVVVMIMAMMGFMMNAGATSAHYASTTIAKLTMFATLCISFRTRALSSRDFLLYMAAPMCFRKPKAL